MKRVFTYGAFDLLHPGHVRLLRAAQRLGDTLLVGVVSDEAINALKGYGRPVQPLAARKEVVKSLRCVYEVYTMPTYDPVPLLKRLQISLGHSNGKLGIEVLCKGDDWVHIPGEEYAKYKGMEFVKLPYSDEFSTTKILDTIRGNNDDTAIRPH